MEVFFERRNRSSVDGLSRPRGKRKRESTYTDDWEEAQKRLRERLQSRDSNTLPLLRKGEKLTFAQWSEHFLETFAKPPIRAQKTHLSYTRVAKHLNAGFGQVLLVDLTAETNRDISAPTFGATS